MVSDRNNVKKAEPHRSRNGVEVELREQNTSARYLDEGKLHELLTELFEAGNYKIRVWDPRIPIFTEGFSKLNDASDEK